MGILALSGCSTAAPPKASVVEPPRSTTTETVSPETTPTAAAPADPPTESTLTTVYATVVSRFEDFSIAIPEDWKLLTPSADDLTTLGSNLDGTLTGISGSALIEDAASIAETIALWAQSPAPSAFRENIQIIRLPGQPELTLEALTDTAVSQVTSMGLVDVSIDGVRVAGLDGVRLTSRTGDTSVAQLFQASVFIIGNEYVWVISFATDDETTLLLFDEMLESFQLLNPRS